MLITTVDLVAKHPRNRNEDGYVPNSGNGWLQEV